MTDPDRAANRKAIDKLHPGNRLRLMAGLPLLPENMTTEQITNLKEALAKASPAPWKWSEDALYDGDGQEVKDETNVITLLRNNADALIHAAEENVMLEKDRDKWRAVATAFANMDRKSLCAEFFQKELTAFDKINNPPSEKS